MGKAAINIACESLAQVVGMFDQMGIRVVGSQESGLRSVCLIIDGECVPNAGFVTGTVSHERTSEKSALTLTFKVE